MQEDMHCRSSKGMELRAQAKKWNSGLKMHNKRNHPIKHTTTKRTSLVRVFSLQNVWLQPKNSFKQSCPVLAQNRLQSLRILMICAKTILGLDNCEAEQVTKDTREHAQVLLCWLWISHFKWKFFTQWFASHLETVVQTNTKACFLPELIAQVWIWRARKKWWLLPVMLRLAKAWLRTWRGESQLTKQDKRKIKKTFLTFCNLGQNTVRPECCGWRLGNSHWLLLKKFCQTGVSS